MDKGTVCLVGAGPGDPGLITVKGLKLLREADVVIYDRLVNRRLLQEVRPEAECIYVGKAVGGAIRQDEINALLIAKAREGKRVVRLKGGDPFVFGRGGEEAEALHAAGIRYEIVPGVTSAVAVPAYAGIPITHRKLSSALTITTGCEDPVEISDLDWEALARGGTLVFLMSVRHLGAIAERLIAWGRHPDTPSAVIAQGTMPQQRTVTGTLGTIALLAVRASVRPPAILVVGEVVRLRERLAWFEERPLFGRRIIITQARGQKSAVVQRLEKLGADVVEFPTIQIPPGGNNERQSRVSRRPS